MDNPLISIIVPTYNSASYLPEALDSVIIQSYSNWELIVIDDGSTDNTKEIVSVYCKKENRIKYYYQTNAGQASARNKGIFNSNGEFIAFLDADDIWTVEKIELQVKTLGHYSVDFIFSGADYFSETYKVTTPPFYQKGVLQGTAFFNDLFQRSSIANSSVLLKREVINKIGLFNESELLRGTEDWDLWLRIAKAGYKFYGIEKKLIKYRVHKDGTHRNKTQMLTGRLNIQDKYRYDNNLPKWIKIKQYRHVYRELINSLYKEGSRNPLLKELGSNLIDRDNKGWCTILQFNLHKLTSEKNFIFISNKILYRIFYRLEHLHYQLIKILLTNKN